MPSKQWPDFWWKCTSNCFKKLLFLNFFFGSMYMSCTVLKGVPIVCSFEWNASKCWMVFANHIPDVCRILDDFSSSASSSRRPSEASRKFTELDPSRWSFNKPFFMCESTRALWRANAEGHRLTITMSWNGLTDSNWTVEWHPLRPNGVKNELNALSHQKYFLHISKLTRAKLYCFFVLPRTDHWSIRTTCYVCSN